MKRFFRIATFFSLALLFLSCTRESRRFRGGSDVIRMTVSSINGTGTKSTKTDELIGTVDMDVLDGDTLRLYAYVSDCEYFQQDPLTKGTVMATDRINVKGQAFTVNAWVSEETEDDGFSMDDHHYISNVSVEKDDDGWKMAKEYGWINEAPITFWSYYPSSVQGMSNVKWPASDSKTVEAQSSVSFDYEVAHGTKDKDGNFSDASSQKDLLFAYNCMIWEKDKSDDFVNVNFRHALCAVRFDISSALQEGVTVQSVKFSNVITGGHCEVVGSDAKYPSISWTFASTPTRSDCAQSYLPADFTEKSLDGEVDAALQSTSNDKIFFFIPQDIKGKDVEITISFERENGSTQVSTATLTHEQPWEAGKIYTYRLSPASDFIDVDVQDIVEKFDKSDLSIQNTGNSRAYIRALLIGAYCENNEGNAIVYSWDPDDSNLGQFTGLPGEKWVKGEDGFWYYTEPVEPQAYTSQLFEKYEAYFMPPVGDSHLEISIAAQAVAYNKNKSTVKEAWSVDKVKLATDASKTINDVLTTK